MFSSIKIFFQKHIFVFIAIIFIFVQGLWFLFSYLLKNDIISRYIVVALVLLGAVFLRYFQKLGFQRKNLFKGLLFASPEIIIGVYSLIATFIFIYRDYRTYVYAPGAYRIFSLNVHMLAIGLLEEILFRGIILNALIYKWKNTKNGLQKAILVSSVIFGLTHLGNLINRPDLLLGIISQVIYATILGILSSVIYLICNNIWPVILFHAFIDWTAMFAFIFVRSNYWAIFTGALLCRSQPVIALIDCIGAILFLLYALWLFRKKYPEILSNYGLKEFTTNDTML